MFEKEKKDSDSLIDILLDEDNHDIITLYDEDNTAIQFEQVGLIALDDKLYALLNPIDMEGVEKDNYLVFRVDFNDDDIILEDDEDILDRVHQEYIAIYNEENSDNAYEDGSKALDDTVSDDEDNEDNEEENEDFSKNLDEMFAAFQDAITRDMNKRSDYENDSLYDESVVPYEWATNAGKGSKYTMRDSAGNKHKFELFARREYKSKTYVLIRDHVNACLSLDWLYINDEKKGTFLLPERMNDILFNEFPEVRTDELFDMPEDDDEEDEPKDYEDINPNVYEEVFLSYNMMTDPTTENFSVLDDNGKTHKFSKVKTVEYEGKTYVIIHDDGEAENMVSTLYVSDINKAVYAIRDNKLADTILKELNDMIIEEKAKELIVDDVDTDNYSASTFSVSDLLSHDETFYMIDNDGKSIKCEKLGYIMYDSRILTAIHMANSPENSLIFLYPCVTKDIAYILKNRKMIVEATALANSEKLILLDEFASNGDDNANRDNDNDNALKTFLHNVSENIIRITNFPRPGDYKSSVRVPHPYADDQFFSNFRIVDVNGKKYMLLHNAKDEDENSLFVVEPIGNDEYRIVTDLAINEKIANKVFHPNKYDAPSNQKATIDAILDSEITTMPISLDGKFTPMRKIITLNLDGNIYVIMQKVNSDDATAILAVHVNPMTLEMDYDVSEDVQQHLLKALEYLYQNDYMDDLSCSTQLLRDDAEKFSSKMLFYSREDGNSDDKTALCIKLIMSTNDIPMDIYADDGIYENNKKIGVYEFNDKNYAIFTSDSDNNFFEIDEANNKIIHVTDEETKKFIFILALEDIVKNHDSDD